MPNQYIYTKYFQSPGTVNNGFENKVYRAFNNLAITIARNPIEDTASIIYINWTLPYYKIYNNKYNNIIKAFAQFMKVKVMYKLILDKASLEPAKGLMIIGEKQRVEIMIHILDYYFKGYFKYESFIKDNLRKESIQAGYKDIRQYASNLLDIQMHNLCRSILNLLENDTKYTQWLEIYILEQFNLDFKNYNTNKPTYYHAISRKFYKNRMLL